MIDARWEGRSDRPEDPGAVYLRVEYAGKLRARVNARAFRRLHVTVDIESDMAEFVQRWFDSAGVAESDEESRAQAVRLWDNRLRADQDAERACRIDAVRRRTAERDAQRTVR